MNVVGIAENHDLTGIFDGPKAASLNFMQEPVAPDQTFDIRHRASDDAAFGDGAGGE